MKISGNEKINGERNGSETNDPTQFYKSHISFVIEHGDKKLLNEIVIRFFLVNRIVNGDGVDADHLKRELILFIIRINVFEIGSEDQIPKFRAYTVTMLIIFIMMDHVMLFYFCP